MVCVFLLHRQPCSTAVFFALYFFFIAKSKKQVQWILGVTAK